MPLSEIQRKERLMDNVTRCPVNNKLEKEHICNTCKYQETTTVKIDVQPMNEQMIIYNEPCHSCWRGSLLKDSDKYEDKWEPKPTQKTALEIIEEVKSDICDKICKYRDYYDQETLLEKCCDGCPLERLA